MTGAPVLGAFALALAACTSSGGAAGSGAAGQGGAGAAAGGAGGSAGLTWEDDGVVQAATHVVATRVHDARFDFLEVAGAQYEGSGLVFSVSIPSPGTLAAGSTHVCAPDAAAVAWFTYATATETGVTTSCAITVAEPGAPGGARATGTFAASITLSAGGTKVIGNGRFDVAVTALQN